MAEMFGVAAGAVGVASLSIQLAESLRKVKGFYASVKNAPLQVAELIEEIEIMQDILSDLEGNSEAVAASSNMKRCIKVARRATISFATFSKELQASVKKSKYRGSARFALSREDIKQMLNQLERTKSSLNLAYSLYQQATSEARHIIVMQAVSSCQGSVLQTKQTEQVSLAQPDSFTAAHRHPRAAGSRVFCITTPAWLSNTIWQLELRRSLAGINIFARTYGIVSRDARIFQACADGDTVEMQRLFEDRLASPYDKDEYGRDLWLKAAACARIDSLHFLSRYSDASKPKLLLSMFHRNAIRQRLADRQAHHLEARVLQDGIAWLRDVFVVACHDASDASEDDSIAPRALQLLACPSKDLESVLFWQAFEDRSIPDHLPSFSEELTKEMLGRYEPTYHHGIHPLQLLAEAYGFTMAWHLFLTHTSDDPFSEYTQNDLAHTTHRLDFLEKTIAITISSGRSIHESGHDRTPLFLFLSMRLCPIVRSRRLVSSVSDLRPRALTGWLSFWLKTLQRASVDLNMYGAEESRVFEQYRSLEHPAAALQRCRDPKYWLYSADELDFILTYGPIPEDWTVKWDVPVERYVREFWQMPGLYDNWLTKAIPGGWIDDKLSQQVTLGWR